MFSVLLLKESILVKDNSW